MCPRQFRPAERERFARKIAIGIKHTTALTEAAPDIVGDMTVAGKRTLAGRMIRLPAIKARIDHMVRKAADEMGVYTPAQHLARLNDLAERAMEARDRRTELSCLEAIGKLMGYSADRIVVGIESKSVGEIQRRLVELAKLSPSVREMRKTIESKSSTPLDGDTDGRKNGQPQQEVLPMRHEQGRKLRPVPDEQDGV